MNPLQGKQILVGVCGGIAAYKAAALTSMLRQAQADVRVMMTANAQRFVAPLTFEALSGKPVCTDMWSLAQNEIEHVAVADWAQAVVVAPATANLLAKLAHGLCDDFLSTTLCATTAPVLLAPAMTTAMWEHPATRRNVAQLTADGYRWIGPREGWLACDKRGMGRMEEPEAIVAALQRLLAGPLS